ncbi:DoxX family membrane protein [Streptomyces sp. NBC_01190]|nr:DoxX family membrane protein [Streptomyces sp. NBC_01190]
MARVPSDPAQVIVNHASFRVQLGAISGRALGLAESARIPMAPLVSGVSGRSATAGGSARPAGSAAGRRRPAPLVWSGNSAPGDPLAGELQQAVRRAGADAAGGVAARGATQVLPRMRERTMPTVVGQRSGGSQTGLLGGVRPVRGAYDPVDDEPGVGWTGGDGEPELRRVRDRRGESAKHAWYPDRRLNLGIVLLPLRVFLGFVSIYAGMGKLCDRVYFDGGKRGSMVHWLSSLHPWGLAEPLRNAALDHPVGAGLSIAFLQVVVGILTVCGLWQRVAAVFGAALSVALLVTVSWRTVPVYDAPDFIYLAAWSPLVIAGAPVYSIDAHLAGDAWRRLGPRASVWDLRRRVLRRGTLLATVIAGSTLLIGSVLGAAVRATTPADHRPGPSVTPTNQLPGAPLPEVSGAPGTTGEPSPTPSRSATAGTGRQHTAQPTRPPTTKAAPPAAGQNHGTGTSGGAGGTPTHESGSTGSATTGGGAQPSQLPPPPPTAAPAPPPATKPPTGAIGGLLGSPPATGLLLGMRATPQSTPQGA